MWYLLLMLVCGGIAAGVFINARLREQKAQDEERAGWQSRKRWLVSTLAKHGMSEDKSLFSQDGTTAIAIAPDKQSLLCVFATWPAGGFSNANLDYRQVPLNKVVGVRAIEADAIHTNNTGGRRQRMCVRMELKIEVQDLTHPVFWILVEGDEIAWGSDAWLERRELVESWESRLRTLAHLRGQA